MKLRTIAAFLAALSLALSLALAAAAETMRAPAAGEPALSVDMPTGWKLTQANGDNAFAMSPEGGTILQLGMITGSDLASYTPARIAEVVLKEMGASPYSRTQAGTLAGRTGTTFISETTNANGVHMALLVDIAWLDDSHAGIAISFIVDGASAEQQAALAAAKARVRLIGAR